jgi:hypothetical protein
MGAETAKDPWRIPTFLMWLVFMLVGFFPDAVFRYLQMAAWVVRYEALVTSPLVLTIAFAGYLAAFAYSESVRGRCPQQLALGNAIQIGAVSLVAFLPVTLEAIRFAMAMQYANLLYVSFIVLTTVAIKLMAWVYLLSFLVRYYLLGQDKVFARMASFFPSARRTADASLERGDGKQSTIRSAPAFEQHEGARRILK